MLSRVAVRMARANTAGGGNWAKSVRASAGTASKSSLAPTMASWTRATRWSGSGSSVGSAAKMPETRFVHFSVSSPVRIDTGTMAMSGTSGRASWVSSQVRSPPAQAAITTSFTVAPRAFLMSFTSSSDVERNAKRRWAVMAALNGVRGAAPVGSGPTVSPSGDRSRPRLSTAPSGPRRPPRTWLAAATTTGARVVRPSSRTVRVGAGRPPWPGLRTRVDAARVSTSLSLGSGSGRHSSTAGLDVVALGVAVEHQHEQLGSGRAVDGGVVDLRRGSRSDRRAAPR